MSPASFVDLDRRQLLSTKSFNNLFGAIGGAEAHNKAIRSKHILRYDSVGFRPIDARSFEHAGRTFFNMYQPQTITPLDGTPQMFLYHLRYLIPDKLSREHLINWLAWVVQYPDKKLMHAVLLLRKPKHPCWDCNHERQEPETGPRATFNR